ncbi:hypothetical protein OV079_17000 [Nannocystis pusilla]|uniref:Lipoprotein n=1 Tax=Nannocystis pusilla TaxID=889268 RepID=A0A9X3EPX6_9BACT|nr:hypothetical protein [Nannocystis pusilla]MCY1007224.1 hypothetical protein [Nannocystis pusilla]
MTRAALVLGLVLCACKEPTGANTGGLVVVSDTSPTEFGDPPECGGTTDGTTGGATDSTGADPTGTSGQVPEDMSEGEAFCAALTSAPACDGVVHGGGVCRWLDVVPVYPGTCDITRCSAPACSCPTRPSARSRPRATRSASACSAAAAATTPSS